MSNNNSLKKVVVIQPSWNSPSETWLFRMNEMLKKHIAAIACFNPPVNIWENIPLINLYGPKKPLLYRAINRFSPIFKYDSREIIEKEIKKIIDAPDVHVLLIHFITTALYVSNIISNTKKKVIVHTHGFDTFPDLRKAHDPDILVHGKDYQEKVGQLSARATYIANSEFTKHNLAALGIPQDKIKVKKFGVDAPAHIPERNNKVPRILYIGRLVDFKGVNFVIDAFLLACSKGMNAELIVAGDGYLRYSGEMKKRLSLFSERIKFIGSVNKEEAEKLYRESDIFTAHNCKGALTRQQEAFGVTMIEAMSYGLPVVNTKSPAIMETVIDGETGILVEPLDIQSHAEAFINLVNNHELRLQMGFAGYSRVKEFFCMEKEKKSLNEILFD